MQAVILAGGRGQRLRPITDYIPKSLVPLAGVPILEWQLTYLKYSGISGVVVCSGYKSSMISHFLERRHIDWATVSAEDEPLGTGGALRHAADLIEDDFIVLNGDIITDIDIRSIRTDCIAAVPLRSRFGVLDIRDDMVINFGEKPILADRWMNAGIYRFGREVLDSLPERGDLERTLFPRWAAAGTLAVSRFPDSRWYSIDSFKDMEECSGYVADVVSGTL